MIKILVLLIGFIPSIVFSCESLNWIIDQVSNEEAWENQSRETARSFLKGMRTGQEALSSTQQLFELSWRTLNIRKKYEKALGESISCEEAEEFYKWKTDIPPNSKKIVGIVEETTSSISQEMVEKVGQYYDLYYPRINGAPEPEDKNRLSVVVANKDLKAGQEINSENMAKRVYLSVNTYDDVVTPKEFDYVEGLKIMNDMEAGSQLRRINLSTHPYRARIDDLIGQIAKLAEELDKAKKCKANCSISDK